MKFASERGTYRILNRRKNYSPYIPHYNSVHELGSHLDLFERDEQNWWDAMTPKRRKKFFTMCKRLVYELAQNQGNNLYLEVFGK